jgi:uncharacterized membrane protein YhaH (DUF805 family)
MIQKYTIGRNPNNHIVVSHPAVSGYHADLIVDDSLGYFQYTYVDHSTNGSMVNGQLLKNASCFVVYNDSILLAGAVHFDWSLVGPMKSYGPDGGGARSQGDSSEVVGREPVSFGGALKSFFDKYVDFRGRATRREFWFTYLWLLIFNIALTLLCTPAWLSALGGMSASEMEDVSFLLMGLGWTSVVWIIYNLVIFLPSLSLLVRRIHDMGWDGLWILMMLVPFVNVIFFFIWTLSPSEPRVNRWGR